MSLNYIKKINFCFRFRVVDEIFVDTSPSGPEGSDKEHTDTDKKTPYTLIVSDVVYLLAHIYVNGQIKQNLFFFI